MMKSKNESKRKTGRFALVKRLKPSRRRSLQESSSCNEVDEMILKNVELVSPSSAVTLDVLGRESISTLDTEREDEYCENSIVEQEDHVAAAAPVTPRQVTKREPSIHTLCKFNLTRLVLLCTSAKQTFPCCF